MFQAEKDQVAEVKKPSLAGNSWGVGLGGLG